jgi:hypothetical protein
MATTRSNKRKRERQKLRAKRRPKQVDKPIVKSPSQGLIAELSRPTPSLGFLIKAIEAQEKLRAF